MRLRHADVTWQELDEHVVVLDLRASVYLEVNESGSVLFPLLTQGTTLDRLAGALVDSYSLSPENAARDAAAFVAVLSDLDLLEG